MEIGSLLIWLKDQTVLESLSIFSNANIFLLISIKIVNDIWILEIISSLLDRGTALFLWFLLASLSLYDFF